MKEYIIKIPFGFAWQFINLPNAVNGIVLDEEQKYKLTSDFNIAIDKISSKIFLTQLEYLTREDVEIYVKIPTKETPEKSPHYLDNENSYIEFDKKSYSNIIVKKIDKGKYISTVGDSMILEFGKQEIFEFFSRMYINFEIYAVHEGNVINVINKETMKAARLVIWGASNGKPIEY